MHEYNIEANEINLYLDKNNKFIEIENSQKLKINSYNSISFIILLFLVLITIIIHLRINKQNNKYFEYINNYVEI